MWRVLAAETEVWSRGGFLYLPLLVDPEIEAEVAGREVPPGEMLLEVNGVYYIKTLAWDSLVANYPAAFPEEYERRRGDLRQRVFPEAADYRPPVDERLKIILGEILPHFRRPRRSRGGEKAGLAAVLNYLGARIRSQDDAAAQVEQLRDQERALQQTVRRLADLEREAGPCPELLGSGRELTGWFEAALQANLAAAEIGRWQGELAQVRELLALPAAALTMLLGVARQGTVEVEGCGCHPDKKHPGDYWVYVRTGEYVLQDYFGRYYLFPDCRVGVSTAGPFQPVVLETYKHPLLRRFESGQPICLTNYQPDLEFSAAAVYRALEEGLNALFYGYNSRKRNGYNSLDEFGRHLSVVDFEDWRISQDDGRVARGEVEVKNGAF